MNHQFARSVRSSTFNLTLSEGHIQALDIIAHRAHRVVNDDNEIIILWSMHESTLSGLLRRGFLELYCGYVSGLTKAGEIVVDMLIEAGYFTYNEPPIPEPSSLPIHNPQRKREEAVA